MRGFSPLSPGFFSVVLHKYACYDFVNSRGNRHREQNVNTYGEYSKNRRGCQRKIAAEVQNMSKEEMIAEIQRVLEDANEWDVRDVYEYVMDEVG